MKTKMTPSQEFIDLLCLDIREYADAYKENVRANPMEHARAIIDGLDENDIRQMTRDLRQERKLCR